MKNNEVILKTHIFKKVIKAELKKKKISSYRFTETAGFKDWFSIVLSWLSDKAGLQNKTTDHTRLI